MNFASVTPLMFAPFTVMLIVCGRPPFNPASEFGLRFRISGTLPPADEPPETRNVLNGVGTFADEPLGPPMTTARGPGIAPFASVKVVVICVPSAFTFSEPVVMKLSIVGAPGVGTNNWTLLAPVRFSPLIVTFTAPPPIAAPPGLTDLTIGTEPLDA